MSGPLASDQLRGFNRARVLAAVDAGAESRAALCTSTGLARSTVTGLVRGLLEDGRLIECRTDDMLRSRGRPVARLRLAPRAELVVAVDLGHSHCRVGIVDATGAVLHAEQALLDVDASPDEAVALAARTARSLLADVDGRRVAGGAIGLPAPVDVSTGSVGDGNVLPRWVDHRPAQQLAAELGLDFAVDNDANLGALAEVAFGAATGVDDLIYVKAASGIGAGLMLGGRIHHGVGGRAGEIGHVPVDPGGPVCRCGNRGCLETLASVTEVLAALQPRQSELVTMADVAALVAGGDPGATRVVADAGRLIGRVLADVVNNLSPQAIVLGGELAAAGPPLLEGVRAAIDQFAQPGLARQLRVQLSSLCADAELLGAAALALARLPIA